MDINKIATAIEKDAGQNIPSLKESLEEMQQKKIAREYAPEQLIVMSAIKASALSQKEFANLIKTPVATLRDWEQGCASPSGGILTLMKIIINRPKVLELIQSKPKS